MSESKYSAQIKHMRENYVRFRIDLKPDILDAFKQKCKENGTTPTTELKKFINEYLKK